MTATDTAVQLAQIAGRAASDKLATDIVLIDVSDRLAITDVFVIVTGNNERQVEAIVDEVEEKLRLAGHKPLRREGKRDGRWVLLDYSEIVVHVQHAEERVFYSLERLWRDCPVIDFDERSRPASPAARVRRHPTIAVLTGRQRLRRGLGAAPDSGVAARSHRAGTLSGATRVRPIHRWTRWARRRPSRSPRWSPRCVRTC